MTASRFKVPHTLVLLFGMVWLAWAAAHLLPQGSFERAPSESNPNRMEVVAGSYAPVAAEDEVSLGWTVPFSILFEGFKHGAEVIFFIFIVGGMFAVMRGTGTVDALIGYLIGKLGSRPKWLVAGGLFVFASLSSTIGMAEEYIPFVPVLVILCISLGFDAVTAIGIICVGYGTGYGVAVLNPFTVLIAQPIAGVQPVSGWEFRLAISVPFFLLAYHHVWRYAKRVHADPTYSYVYGIKAPVEQPESQLPFEGKHRLVLAAFVSTLVFMVYAIKEWEWYMVELGALFFALAIAIGVLGRLSLDGMAAEFCKGAAELTSTALLIAFAYSISLVLEEGQVIDTVIQAIAGPLSSLPAHIAASGMFLVQCALNFFIPSGSGQAYVTMPIMAPLADLVGISRQTAVLAYQFGDGFTNILVPTNAVLVGILAMAGIPYDRWVKFVFPFIIKAFLLGSLALMVAVAIEL